VHSIYSSLKNKKMYSKSVNTRSNSPLEVAKVLAIYGLVVVGVFFHHHVKEMLTYYTLLFLAVAFLTRKSWSKKA